MIPIPGATGSSTESWSAGATVFLGTVTDTGPTPAAFEAELHRKFSARELEHIENSKPVPDAHAKKLWKRMFPKQAHQHLSLVRTADEFGALIEEYFPAFREEGRPVRFRVEETFQGKPLKTREVWTRQGFGDYGYNFELGKQYLVETSLDETTGREETGTC